MDDRFFFYVSPGGETQGGKIRGKRRKSPEKKKMAGMLSVHTTVLLASIVALGALVVLSAIPRGDNAPKRGIIMMYCTPNIAGDWARYTIEVNRTYARRHNYAFVVVSTPYDPRVTHAWQKIPAMIELLDRGSYAFVVYMDADAIVNKHEVPYERFLERYAGRRHPRV